MKTLFFFFVIFVFLHLQKKNNIIKEPFENPDEKIFKSCGNKYLIDYNPFEEPENGLYTEILKMKYKEFRNFKDDIPICYEEIHPRNDKVLKESSDPVECNDCSVRLMPKLHTGWLKLEVLIISLL